MKLWAFGDSYTIDGRQTASADIIWQNIDKSWVELLQKKLNSSALNIFCSSGRCK